MLLLSSLMALSSMAEVKAADENPQNIYDDGQKALKAEDFQGAIDAFQQLQNDYPDNPFTQRASLDLAYAYYRLGDYSAARIEAERFISANPKHPKLPFAYYVAGLTYYTTSLKLITTPKANLERANDTAQQALHYFGLLAEKFPDSEYTEHARLRSSYLLEKLTSSEHELASIAPVTPLTSDFGQDAEIKKADWILQQMPSHYTLKLITSPNLVEILQTIEEHGLTSQAMIYEIERHNGTIYTLLYGLFPSEKVAMDIGSRLPRDILNIQPSIKSMGEIQAEIAQNRQARQPGYTPPVATKATTQTTEKEKTPPPATATIAGSGFINEWIMARNPRHYTLQLAGMKRERSVKRFIKEHPTDKAIGYYHGLRKGMEWYGVIHGEFATMKQAKAAAKELKAELGIDQPWIRRIREIQKSIQGLQAGKK